MTTDIRCPHLGVSGGDVTLASWLVKEGDFAHQGQPIAELELEKSAIDLEAPISGRLVQLAVPEGAEGIHADDLLAVMAPEEESPALLDDEPVLKDEVVAEGGPAGVENETLSVGGKVPPDASVAVDPAGPHQARDIRSLESPSTGPTTVPRLPAPGSGSATATPLAHRMAAQAGIQLSAAGGTGGDGCITKADVERLIESATETVDPAAGRTAAEQDEHPGTRTRSQGVPLETDPVSAPQACEPIPLPRMRKVIAERMSLAKRTIPHFYLEISCATDTINSIRRQLNEQSGYCFTVNDFVIRAAALALVEAPE